MSKKKMGMRTKKPLNKGTKAQEKKKFIKIGIKNFKKKLTNKQKQNILKKPMCMGIFVLHL